MSNKLAKSGFGFPKQSQEAAERQREEFQAQYACIFALAIRYLKEHNGCVELPVVEVDSVSRDMLSFKAMDANKNVIDIPDGKMPAFIRCEHIPKGVDA